MNKLNLYPKLKVETIAKNKKQQELLLFDASNGQGFKVKGDVADLCIKLSGRKTLETIINEFKAEHTKVDYNIDHEIEKLLTLLEEQNAVEYLQTPIA